MDEFLGIDGIVNVELKAMVTFLNLSLTRGGIDTLFVSFSIP